MRFGLALSLVLLGAVLLGAQAPVQRATTVEAIRVYPGFFHGQAVAVAGTVVRDGREGTLTTDAGTLRLSGRQMPDDGPAELRGIVYDIGRLHADDPRFGALDLGDLVTRLYGDRWPRPGEEVVLSVSHADKPAGVVSATEPPLHAVALAPERYVDQRLVLVGQFRGRNLYGDVPEAPTADRNDFVVRAGDAAIWVTGVRPRGKGFAFDPTRRVDTGRWVRVTGTMRYARGLVWMEGTGIELADAPATETAEVVVPPPPPPPLQVLFSAPSEGEIDVRPDSPIRLQFSRDLDPSSLDDRVRLTYVAAGADAAAPGGTLAVAFDYTPATRGLEIRPAQPFAPFSRVVLELLDGIHGPDGARLDPFKLTFTVGSN